MFSSHRQHNFFAGNDFNRLAERRTDTAWLAQQLTAGTAYLVPVWHGRNLVRGGAPSPSIALIEYAACAQCMPHLDLEHLVLLGEFRGKLCFAVELPDDPPSLDNAAEFHELRSIGGFLNRDEAGLLGYARALLLWREKHRHCGRCGALNLSSQGGHVLKCSNPHCGQSQFPRLDPAVIVLVSDGERVLLGRQAVWPPGRYSTIAGYVEWAESLEEAVAREVFEETGVVVDNVEYHSSQPWPFPSSLMLGFIAHAVTTDIVRHDSELEDVGWFTRADLANGVVTLPPEHAIAYRLIETWYDANAERALRAEPHALALAIPPSAE